jgi:hypothetical protein
MTNEEEVRVPMSEAAKEGGDLREKVRNLVLQAILNRKADPKAIREVMQEAVAGLGDGLGGHVDDASSSLKSAMAGLNDALSKSLYAVQSAVEETWGNGRQFAQSDLREAYDAVRGLDDDMVATLKKVGGKSQGVLRDEFQRLSDHLGRNGSDAGAQMRTLLEMLGRDLGQSASEASRVVSEDAREASGRLSDVTSGILRGIADAFDSRKA